MKQMSLFDDGRSEQDTTPLPLLIAKRYRFALQHHTADDDTMVYAVQDWIAGITGETDAKTISKMWVKFKNQSSTSSSTLNLVKLAYRATDGKKYQRDFAPDVDLYRFAAYARVTQERPQLEEIKNYLAKSGAFVDNMRTSPEDVEVQIAAHRKAKSLKSNDDPAWNAAREIGVLTRKQFTAMLVSLNPSVSIGQATNDVYQGVFNADAAKLRERLGIGAKGNPRDHMSRLALIYTMAAEEACRIELSAFDEDDTIPVSLIRSVIMKMARLTGLQAQDMAKALGVELVTGQPLLKA